MILGTISAVDDTDCLQLIIDGEDEPTTKKYTYMASYVPEANDRVLIEEIGGSYVIMGKIISDTASSGIARMAQSAVNAENATNATNAENATNATNAETAATSDVSTKTNGFSITVPSVYGSLVTYVQTRYFSELGASVVTGLTLSSSANFTTK